MTLFLSPVASVDNKRASEQAALALFSWGGGLLTIRAGVRGSRSPKAGSTPFYWTPESGGEASSSHLPSDSTPFFPRSLGPSPADSYQSLPGAWRQPHAGASSLLSAQLALPGWTPLFF